jgi:hypothetical protein
MIGCAIKLDKADRPWFHRPLAIAPEASDNPAEMSGIFFDLPSVRFPRRYRFFDPMLRTFAASLIRCMRAPVFASRQVRSWHDEAEFPVASRSTCKLLEPILRGSRAADRVPNAFGALRPCNNWENLKDQHELLFTRETPAPFARRVSTKERSPASGTACEGAQKNILAASRGIFRKRERGKEARHGIPQWRATFAAGA